MGRLNMPGQAAPRTRSSMVVSVIMAAAWAIFIFAVLAKKSWAIPVGIFAGTMSMLAGYPLGLHNALIEVHRFSMFLPAPLLSTGLFIYLWLPGTRKMLAAWNGSSQESVVKPGARAEILAEQPAQA